MAAPRVLTRAEEAHQAFSLLPDTPTEERLTAYVRRFPELGVTESNVARFYDSSVPMSPSYYAKKKVGEALYKKYPIEGRGSAKSDPLVRQKEFPTNYPQDAVDILKAMAFNDGKGLNIVGSMSVRSQEWAGDYDGYQVAELSEKSDAAAAKVFARQWADNIKKLRALKDVWIGDIKCGSVEEWRVIPRTARVVDGKIVDYNATACRKRLDELKAKGVISPAEAKDAAELCKPSPSVSDFLLAKQKVKFHIVRWTPAEILVGRKKLRDGSVMTLAQAIQTPTIGKMDCVGLVQNSRFTDFSVIYEFRNKGKTLNPDKINIGESLREAILAYSAEGNYFKVLKRRYALAKAENDLAMVRKLTPILNSDLGRLYHITGDIGTLVNLLEQKRVPMAKVRYEIDQFIGRLSGIWTMKDYLKDETEIIGKLHAILKMAKPRMALALDKLGDQLEGYLQHATKAVVQRAGLPLKGGADGDEEHPLMKRLRAAAALVRDLDARRRELLSQRKREEAAAVSAQLQKELSAMNALQEIMKGDRMYIPSGAVGVTYSGTPEGRGGSRRSAYLERIKKGPPETAASIREKARIARAIAQLKKEAELKMPAAAKPTREEARLAREIAAARAKARELMARAEGPKGRGRATEGRRQTGGATAAELKRMAAVRRLARLEQEYDEQLRERMRLNARLEALHAIDPGSKYIRVILTAQRHNEAQLRELDEEMGRLVALIRSIPAGLSGKGFWDSITSFLSGLFGKKKTAEAPAAPADPVEEAKKALAALGIGSRKEFNKWALKNHPDKGGDTAQFQRVSSLADKAFKGGRRRKIGGARSKEEMERDLARMREGAKEKVLAKRGRSPPTPPHALRPAPAPAPAPAPVPAAAAASSSGIGRKLVFTGKGRAAKRTSSC